MKGVALRAVQLAKALAPRLLRAPLFAKGRYVAATSWRPWPAIVASCAILIATAVIAIAIPLLLDAIYGAPGGPVFLPDDASGALPASVLLAMLLAQGTTIIATLWVAARHFGGIRNLATGSVANLLALKRVALRTILSAFAALLAVLAVYNGLVEILDPGAWYKDLAQFQVIVHSSYWWLFAIVVGLGAPLSEELLFRGFLLPALAQTRLGFLGAALATSAGWTVLHWGYSASGLLEVFLIGMFLSAVLWRTGSLWVTIFCHGIYNLGLVVVLRMI